MYICVCLYIYHTKPFYLFIKGQVTSTQRIEAALPTIVYALEHGAKVKFV